MSPTMMPDAMTPVAPPSIAPPGDGRYELIDGQKKATPPMGVFACLIATDLAYWLNQYARTQNLGLVFAETLFRLSDTVSRRPDLAFVSRDRLPGSSVMRADPAQFNFAPDLAVEVISPTNSAVEVEEKTLEYLEAGVKLVWIIYPRLERFHVIQSTAGSRVLSAADTLDGEPVLPGFQLPLSRLFTDPFAGSGNEA